MTPRILIVQDDSEQASYRFEESVRPLLKAAVETEVVGSAQEAEERLRANDYPVAIVEGVLHKKPVDYDNLAGMDLEELACPASRVIPAFAALRPRMKVIVVSHSRSGMSKEEKQALSSLPCVVGVFGWLNAAANAKKVAELLAAHLPPA